MASGLSSSYTRRRRIEWPTMDRNIWDIIHSREADSNAANSNLEIPETARALVVRELSKCDTRQGFVPDLQIYDQSAEWNADLHWLSTMIVRTGVQLDKLFETIEASGFLGEFEREAFEYYQVQPKGLQIAQNTKENEGQLLPDGTISPKRMQLDSGYPMGLTQTPKSLRLRSETAKTSLMPLRRHSEMQRA
ncbi:predicted protein [Uncinocarpus reesii 1704]|uniref:Uncharacterized protein n=1 Tax=Uncinocarpus reesii (strain UAMH 1704) TaxID=336963 RepID=C4JY16_UNCRE|nr:uncharacterized protein UREG_07067 [Uncinocarpus reesii 1704]EEP82202.1 predicted protein [Uncinocarpus reesii 1704]